MTQEVPELGQGSPELTDGESVRRPWKDNGPVALESVSLSDIDDSDTTFQFRFRSDWKQLQESLVTNGQLNPIKLVAGEGAFRIVDGHSRFCAIKNLGWMKIEAMIYRGMTDREAKALSYEANVTRRNLSFAEKVNAMQDAVNDGFGREDVATMFSMSRRTVDRHLEMPEDLRNHVDCKTVTMAHGKALAPMLERDAGESIEEVVRWIREEKASVPQLKKKLKELGVQGRRGRAAKFGHFKSGTVYGHRFEMGPESTPKERKQAIAFLLEAVRRLQRMGDGAAVDEHSAHD